MNTTISSPAGQDTSGHPLIASDRVAGTAVRRPNGDRIGTVDRVVIEKRSGRVVYAVMSFGGSLGMGEGTRTLPWSLLRYSTKLDAYELDLADDRIQDAPQTLPGGQDPSSDREWERHVHSYFNADPYWGEAAPRATEEAQGS